MNRVNRILSIALVAQLAIAALVFVPRILPASAESAPLFGAIQAQDIQSLKIQNSEGKTVELAWQGETWIVPSAAGYPADVAKIDAFLGQLVGLTTNPLVTRTGDSHERLQVADDDFASRIDFTLADGSSHTLYIGSSASGGSHVRAGGRDEVYLARDLFSYEASAEVTGWIDAVYFAVAEDQMFGLTLQNANGTFEFEKPDPASAQWTLNGLAADEQFNPNNLTTLLTRLASLRMIEPLGKEDKPEYGLDDPGAVITIVADDGSGGRKTITLTIGAKQTPAEEGGQATYVMKSSESEYYVRANDFSVEDFVTRTREDFLQPPPTPTPTPEVSATPELTTTLVITGTPEITATPPVTPALTVTPQATP